MEENVNATGHGGPETGSKIPRRDWIIMPVIGVLTIVLLSVFVEWISSANFSGTSTNTATCGIVNDPSTGVRAIPNCTYVSNGLDGTAIEYSFNSCGHRAGMQCGPKPPGVFRIVMIGSSIAEGLYVRRQDSLAAHLPADLSQRTGRKIELYNEGMLFGFSHSQTLRFDDALKQSPDMIFWPITPEDVRSALEILPGVSSDPGDGISRRQKAWRRAKGILNPKSTVGAVAELFDRTSAAGWIRRVLFTNENQYLKSYLIPGNESAGFLLVQPTPEWRDRLIQFDKDAANIEGRAQAAGVPFVAALVPFREQAAMLSIGEWPPGYDPYKLDDELRSIITRHGGIYVDILPAFREIRNPERYYFPIDGHPTAAGHELIANLLAKQLTSGAVSALTIPTQPLSGAR